jgi:DNA polymerase
MSDFDPREELRELTAGFRSTLEWHQRAGVHAAPVGATVRPELPELPDASHAEPYADDSGSATQRIALPTVREDLGECTRCKLHATRNKIVFGVGDPNASLVFIGEAPGADEDRLGEPFVGKAGQLLDKMIEAMGWTRDTVYIANVLKCRPPRNRDPEPDEIDACRPFLARQIEAIAPRMIVTLGKPAAHLILNSRAPMGALRGRFKEYLGIRVMPTFHPAYLLRDPNRKRDTWSDLKQVIAELERVGVQPPLQPRT